MVDTLDRYTEKLRPLLLQVPPQGPEVCSLCHGPKEPNSGSECKTCTRTTARIATEQRLPHGVPITLYQRKAEDRIYPILRDYKSGNRSEEEKKALRWRVASLVARFFRDHGRCMEDALGRWDGVMVVPTTTYQRRAMTHPLESVLEHTETMKDRLSEQALEATSTEVPNHQCNPDLFRTTRSVAGERILFIDDVWVTGSNIHSASARLTLEGATVMGGVVIGLQVDPRWVDSEYGDIAAKYWEKVLDTRFDFARCCLNVGQDACSPDSGHDGVSS